MATTHFDFLVFPVHAAAGFQYVVTLRALTVTGAVDATYSGTVHFTSTDALASLPADYTFQPGDSGQHRFPLKLRGLGPQKVTATDALIPATGIGRSTVVDHLPGWGFDDFGIEPYGDSAAGLGVHLSHAVAVSTHEVDVTVSGLVQDDAPILNGDALNPGTWQLQRLDTGAFLHVVNVIQVGTYTYRLLSLEAFGPVTTTHEVSSTTLLDAAGNPIVSPTTTDFAGLIAAATASIDAIIAEKTTAARDIANPQFPTGVNFGGTLKIDGAGDYVLETGAPLVRKLILRRLMSKPGDFFHLPNYGIGIQEKQPVPQAELGKLQAAIVQQVLAEPEVGSASVTVTQNSNGELDINVSAVLKKTGTKVEVGYSPAQKGLVL